jgi:hypothetical protein
MASAQQRIASMLRTNIATRYQAAVTGVAQSGTDAPSGLYQQEIDNVLNAIVNVSYSGAQREADWWSLRRRTDPDGTSNDQYSAWVLYTVPRVEMNRQIAFAMETSVARDSALYDVTVALARDILLQGFDEKELQSTAAIQRTAVDNYDAPGTVVALGINEIDLADEYLIGRQVAAAILSNYRVLNNPVLTEYVNNICAAIVINSPKPVSFNGYHVAVLDSDTVNAFASPGGHIFITRGLINAAKSEDALAAVIAHEVAHIQLHHGVRAIRASRDVEEWMNQFTSSGAQIISDRINAGFSQTQEFDADITALSLLAAAGYSPQGLADMLQELERIQGSSIGGFNSTHPNPTARLVNVRIALNRYSNIPDTSRFRQRRFTAIVGN